MPVKRGAVIAFLAASLAASCGDSNPFIGKWNLSADSRKGFCSFLGQIEFTEKLFKSTTSTQSYTLERDGNNYIIDTREPGKNKATAKINADKTMTLNLGPTLLGGEIVCIFERASS